MLGRELEIGQLTVVAVGDADKHLCLGIVDRVLTNTGCVDVKTCRLDRNPEWEIERYAYPANQLLTFGMNELNRHNPLHKKLLQEMFKAP